MAAQPTRLGGHAARRLALAGVVAAWLLAACSPVDTWRSLEERASRLAEQGQLDAAATTADEAVRYAEEAFGASHPNVAVSLNNLALTHARRGEPRRAEREYRRALALVESSLEPGHQLAVATRRNLFGLYMAERRYAAAEALALASLAAAETSHGRDGAASVAPLLDLAELYRLSGRYDEAEAAGRRALGVAERNGGTGGRRTIEPLRALARLYRFEQRYAEAEEVYGRARGVAETPEVLDDLAALYFETGRTEQFRETAARAAELRQRGL